MDRYKIVDTIARERRVEMLAQNVAHFHMTRDLQDLCQMVYEILLTMDEDKLMDLWNNGEINFFLVRVLTNQLTGSRSAYYTQIRKFSEHSEEIGDIDISNDTDLWQT